MCMRACFCGGGGGDGGGGDGDGGGSGGGGGCEDGEGTSKLACKNLWVAWHSPINRETPVFAQPPPSSRQ